MSENDAGGMVDRLLRVDTALYKLAFSSILLVFVLWITLTSFNYSPSARLFPLTVSIATLALLTLVVFINLEEVSGRSVIPDRLPVQGDASTESPTEELPQERRSIAMIVGWIVAILVLTFVVGMDFALFVFLLLYYRYQVALSWVRSAIITVVLWAFIVGIFAIVLGVPFPQGIVVEFLLG